MTDYQPLNCDLHDELEIAAMRGKPVQLQWRDVDGTRRTGMGVVRNIEVSNGEEFLIVEVDGERLRIRLDQLEPSCFPIRALT